MSKESISTVIRAEGEELQKLADRIDCEAVGKLVDWIVGHPEKKLFFTGCGTSAMAAQKVVHTMRVVNQTAFYINPSDAVHGSIGAVGEGDLVVFLSKGGSTRELAAFLDNIRAKKAYIVAVTENAESVIARAADLTLLVQIDREPDAFNMLATASTLAVISVFDAVAIEVAKETDFSKRDFLENHPSGAVGARLQAEVGGE